MSGATPAQSEEYRRLGLATDRFLREAWDGGMGARLLGIHREFRAARNSIADGYLQAEALRTRGDFAGAVTMIRRVYASTLRFADFAERSSLSSIRDHITTSIYEDALAALRAAGDATIALGSGIGFGLVAGIGLVAWLFFGGRR